MIRSNNSLLYCRNRQLAIRIWNLKPEDPLLTVLRVLSLDFGFSILAGHVTILQPNWYVTNAGLLDIARRKHCRGIQTEFIAKLSDPVLDRFAFKATIFTCVTCKGFVGYGDANPSNVSPLVRGAEMRVAETRAVNRALRKAYGIGLCSVEEIGSSPGPSSTSQVSQKIPPQPVNGYSHTTGLRVRDRLCQLIRQHQLDPNLVKSYAMDFCGVKVLRDATREQLEKFVTQLGDQAARDRDVLLNQLNTYRGNQEGAA